MIWLTWRQLRASAVTLFAVLGAVAVALALTGPGLHREYADRLAQCGGCSAEAFDDFNSSHGGPYSALILMVFVLPAAVGMFWGAPLIGREYETGTQDLVWQQSVPRRRWLAVKLGLVGPPAIAAAALAVAPADWWSRPLDATALGGLSRMSPLLFDVRGFVVLGHTAFAFTLGAAAGLLIRRTVPAMAVTLAIFIAAQIVMPTLVRPHLSTPVRLTAVITAQSIHGVDASGADGTVRRLLVDMAPRGAWVLSNETVDSAGRTVDALPAWAAECDTPLWPTGEVTQQQCLQRLADAGYRQAVTYQPADRFWRLQAYETAIFATLSLLLAACCFLWIRPQ